MLCCRRRYPQSSPMITYFTVITPITITLVRVVLFSATVAISNFKVLLTAVTMEYYLLFFTMWWYYYYSLTVLIKVMVRFEARL